MSAQARVLKRLLTQVHSEAVLLDLANDILVSRHAGQISADEVDELAGLYVEAGQRLGRETANEAAQ